MKTQTPSLQMISVEDIVVSKNNPRTEDDPGFNKENLQELGKSIKEQGLIQAIVVRKNGKPGKWELVCGERRLRASRLVGITELPAQIRELTDDQAFELQITENLQRKDVHPLDEAVAFKALMDRNENTTLKDMALRFGKTESFIAQRIKLNDLLSELKKKYYRGEIEIGHAILLARLDKDIQKRVIDDLDLEQSVNDLKDDIEGNLMHKLSAAIFSKEDATLCPKAGACTTCPKRTGNSPALFPEFTKNDDRCLDESCFDKKKEAHTVRQLTKILEEDPKTLILRDYQDPEPALIKLCQDMKVRILREYSDFQGYNSGNMKKVRGFYISGSNIGKRKDVYIRKEVNKQLDRKGDDKAAIQAQVSGIQERQRRSRELDEEKIAPLVFEALEKNQAFISNRPLIQQEWMALIMQLVDYSSINTRSKTASLIGISSGDYRHKALYNKLKTKSISQMQTLMNQIVRILVLEKFEPTTGMQVETHGQSALVQDIATHYVPAQVKKIRDEQMDIRKKREERAKERIGGLKEKIKAGKEKPKAKK